jgi:ADP-ribose pyrophosphatase YjhB (NUDIX family)
VAGRWLELARRLQAVAQTGLAYAENPFDRARYEEVRTLAVELAAAAEPAEPLAAAFAAEYGHATPKLDVRAAVIQEGSVLLVRSAEDGLWSLPGGWAEVGERPREAVEKELREETGLAGRVRSLVGVWERDLRARPRLPAHVWRLVFLCELTGGEQGHVQAAEIAEVAWFPEDALPSLGGRTTPEQLAACYARMRNPGLPAHLD